MYGYTFYLEHATSQDKENGKNTGNVIAIEEKGDLICRGWVAFDDKPNSDNLDYIPIFNEDLKDKCEEITEDEAKIHHPNLFNFLNSIF